MLACAARNQINLFNGLEEIVRGLPQFTDPLSTPNGGDMHDSFETVWRKIAAHAGEQFQTKTGQVFRYEIVNNDCIRPTNSDQSVCRTDVEALYRTVAGADTRTIASLTEGPSFVWAILADKRIGAV